MLVINYASSLLSVTVALAAVTPPRMKGLKMDFEILHGDSIENASPHRKVQVVKRSEDSSSFGLKTTIMFYQAKLKVGSNKDECTVLIDSGSSDTYFMGRDLVCERNSNGNELASDAEVQNADGYATAPKPAPSRSSKKAFELNECNALGSFSTAGSVSFRRNESAPDFHLQFLDGTYSSGVWGTDTVQLSDTEVHMSFGVVNKTSCTQGLLGIGPKFGQQTYTGPSKYTYDNFPMQLKNSGIIKKSVYAVHLSKSFEVKGTLSFGTVDHKKYIGQLQTVPIVNLYKRFKRLDSLTIKLDAMYLQSDNQKITIMKEPIGAVLDSGASSLHLPGNVLKALANSMQGKYLPDMDLYEIDCAYMKNSGNLVYDFSGIEISVPVNEMIIDLQDTCYLEANSISNDTLFPMAYLGGNFHKNAYIIYDLDDMEVSMAQASYTEEEDVEMVKTTIPRAVKAPRYSSTKLTSNLSEYIPSIFKPFDSQW